MPYSVDDVATSTRRAEYAETTRQALVAAARELFARNGYPNTSLDEVAAAARVTKGALYHHFAGKKELFHAVAEEAEAEVLAEVARRPAEITDPWEALVAGVDRYLDALSRPDLQQVLLVDAPTVLGWTEVRRLGCGVELTRSALHAAIRAGVIRPQPVEPLAHMIVAAAAEGALYIAQAEDDRAARDEVGHSVRSLLEGIR